MRNIVVTNVTSAHYISIVVRIFLVVLNKYCVVAIYYTFFQSSSNLILNQVTSNKESDLKEVNNQIDRYYKLYDKSKNDQERRCLWFDYVHL